jgi:hypothetical protein
MPEAGTPEGAARRWHARTAEELTSTQLTAISHLLERAMKAVWDSFDAPYPEQASLDPGRSVDAPVVSRPYNVFCIDGSRGSGKTYVMLSIESLIQARSAAPDAKEVMDFEKQLLTSVGKDRSTTYWGKVTERLGSNRRLAVTLRAIIPGDMEGGDTVMESIILGLTEHIEQKRAAYSNKGDRTAEHEWAELARQLRDEVHAGWIFARQLGAAALTRDAIDYSEMVESYAKEAGKSNKRVARWRAFVSKFLKVSGAKTLWIFLDDSDLSPDLIDSMLDAIRIYLCHPQIIVVLAANIASLREELLLDRMRNLGEAIQALNREGHPAGDSWRAAARREIEEYLEKVLPHPQRFFLSPPAIVLTRPRRANESVQQMRAKGKTLDFATIAGVDFRKLVFDQLDAARPDFLDAKYTSAGNLEAFRQEYVSDDVLAKTERFLSWWLFTFWYAPVLTPRTPRQIRAFADFFRLDGGGGQSRDAAARRKRLPVVLFRDPGNFSLSQRMSDGDPRVVRWLRRQNLKSRWDGRRAFVVNDTELFEGDYPYEYIKYRIDLTIAQPIRDNPESIILDELIPSVVGRQRLRPFFQPEPMTDRPRLIGMTRWLDHSAIPGNCIYFYNLCSLPDICFAPSHHGKGDAPENFSKKALELRSGHWESDLHQSWLDILEPGQNIRILQYFTDSVCQSLKDSHAHTTSELIRARDNLSSKDPTAFIKRIAEFTIKVADKMRDFGNKSILTIDYSTYIKAYHACLVNDWRRAWHAVRIYRSRSSVSGVQTEDVTLNSEYSKTQMFDNKVRYSFIEARTLRNVLAEDAWVASVFGMINELSKEVGPACKSVIPNANDGGLASRGNEDLASAPSGSVTIATYFKSASDVRIINSNKDSVTKTNKDSVTGSNAAISSRQYEIASHHSRMQESRWATSILYTLPSDTVGYDYDPEKKVTSQFLEATEVALAKVIESLATSPSAMSAILNGDLLSPTRNEDFQSELGIDFGQRARSAREFLLLTYGIASSFPALIHMEVFSIYFDWCLNSKNSEDPAATNMPYEIAKKCEEWRNLIVHMTLACRFIKRISMTRDLLHVFAAGPSLTTDHSSEEQIRRALEERRLKFFKTSALDDFFGQMDDDSALRVANGLIDVFCAGVGTTTDHLFGRDRQDIGVAGKGAERSDDGDFFNSSAFGHRGRGSYVFNPDILPETLFGEDWARRNFFGIVVAMLDKNIDQFRGILSPTIGDGDVKTLIEKFNDKKWREKAFSNRPSGSGIFPELDTNLWAALAFVNELEAVLKPSMERSRPPSTSVGLKDSEPTQPESPSVGPEISEL